MENPKVFLRIETPFSLKNPRTLYMALMFVLMPLGMAAVTVMMFLLPQKNPNVPYYFAGVAIAWFVLGMIPASLMIFNSYARAEDGDLVVNQLGFFEKRYLRSSLEKVKRENGRLAIYAEGKPVASMPCSPAAEELVRYLRVPGETNAF